MTLHFLNDVAYDAESTHVKHKIYVIIASLKSIQQLILTFTLGFTDIKKPNVLHHPMQTKNLHFNP